MECKAVLFDLDDTLFDRNAAQIRVIELITQQFSHVFSSHTKKRVIEAFIESDRLSTIDFDAGMPSEGLRQKRTRIFLQLLGIKEDYTDAITNMYVREYPIVNMPITGAVPLVKRLSKKLPVAVVSNGLPDVQYEKIKAIGLGNVFSYVILSEEIGIRKPDSRIFQHAASLLKVKPSVCLYVGDSYSNDVVGAKSAGMRVCWFKRDSSDPENMGIQPDFVITDLGELINILD